MFAPSNNSTLFKAAKVEQGGYAVVWNGNIDISKYKLWGHGQAMPMLPMSGFTWFKHAPR